MTVSVRTLIELLQELPATVGENVQVNTDGVNIEEHFARSHAVVTLRFSGEQLGDIIALFQKSTQKRPRPFGERDAKADPNWPPQSEEQQFAQRMRERRETARRG